MSPITKPDLCNALAIRKAARHITGLYYRHADHSRGDRPVATVEGRDATFDEAVAKAAEILRMARSPLVLGLTRTTIEAQREAVALADRIGATIDPGGSDSLARWRAIQRVGIVSATLGEVRDRADVVVFWGVDPVTTHPRHLERYSADPAGRFIPEGRRGRTLVVVDAEPNATAGIADRFVRVEREGQGAALSTLRMLVRSVEPIRTDELLRELAGLMKSARYGAFFFGTGLDGSAVEEALKLVRDLNRHTRFVTLTMGAAGNRAGAEAVLSWQAGSPRAVDYSEGFPRFLPDEATAESRLTRGECDAAVMVADDPTGSLTEGAIAALREIPTIAVAPRASERAATVAMNAGTPGIHAGGTVLRSDGAALPLRPALISDLPSERDWIVAIRERMEAAP